MRVVRVLFLALVGLAAVPAESMAQAAPSACVAAAADNDAPQLDAACAAIIDDPNASLDARVEALLLRGVWHYRGRRSEEAKRDIERGLLLAPEHPKLLQLRASLHLDDGEIDAAETLAKRSAEIDRRPVDRARLFQSRNRSSA